MTSSACIASSPRCLLQNPVHCSRTGKVAPDSAGESYEPETAADYHRRGSGGGPAPRQIDAQLLPLAHLRGVGESTRRSSTSHHAENRISLWRVESTARLVTSAEVFRENPPKSFKSAESCLHGTQSLVGHSGPCQFGAFAGKGPSTSELMLRVHHLCENRPARRLQEIPSRRSDRRARRSVAYCHSALYCRLLVPSPGHCKFDWARRCFKGL